MVVAILINQALAWIDYLIGVYSLEHHHKDLSLHLEAGHVAVVCHHGDCLSDAPGEEVLIKDCGHSWLLDKCAAKRMHACVSKLHQIWFLVLHCKQNCVDYCLEALRALAKQTSRAVLNYVHNKTEKSFAELWERGCVSLDHQQGALAQCLHDRG